MALQFAHGEIQWLTTQALNTLITVSGLGFEPKAIRFYWVGLQSNSPTTGVSQAVNERRGVGFAVSAASRRSVGTFNQDNSAAANCGSVATSTACVITVNGNGTVDGLLDIDSINTDGFVMIVDDVTPANITVFWEAWGGTDISIATVGDITEPAATGTQNYTVNGFTSDGLNQCVMLAGVQSTQALGTGQAQDSGLHVGFATSTATANQVTVCGNSDDGSATMDTDGYSIQGECLSMIQIAGGNPNARARLSAWGTNLFTLNWLARATTGRRSIFLAIKGGSWQSGTYTINGNTLNATATVSNLPFFPLGVSLIGRMTATQTAGTSTIQDRIGFGSGKGKSGDSAIDITRNAAGILDEDGTANVEINTYVAYNAVLGFPSNAGGIQATYDLNSVTANSFEIIVDVAGGVANELQGYLTFGSQRNAVPISIGHPFIT
jgi:hypothetical protein